MPDILIRKTARAGHITLDRPEALNALTWEMCRAIDTALEDWRSDPDIALVLIDAAGNRAFCAGGDIAEMYEAGQRGDFDYGAQFWADEYRLNLKLSRYDKPIVSFLHGFTMGGGVGIGCHGSHRIVCESSRIAMPECGIGLIPDVGGSLLLARAPGRLGLYLGLTGARMSPGDAIQCGFADHFLPEDSWPALKTTLSDTGDIAALQPETPPPSDLAKNQPQIDTLFEASTVELILDALDAAGTDLAEKTAAQIRRNSPLSMACALTLITRLTESSTLAEALNWEYRFTSRAARYGDFLEGIRAAIIEKGSTPNWRHPIGGISGDDLARMLAPVPNPPIAEGDIP
ncbi:enoyl-CoA hydratase/isomerase family protein [Aestuariibius insulae]|uniref:enoyl-CoA hydratase/isomerase family protein n=1 Tax=Aestuariibius insulae TaxID=2058287 RepID=UPI00345E8DB3